MIIHRFFSIALVGLGLAAGSARAQDFRQETIGYADLDLSREEGARALISRIKAASQRVCEDYATPMDLAGQRERRTCLAESVKSAVAQAHSPMLTALLDGKASPSKLDLAEASTDASHRAGH